MINDSHCFLHPPWKPKSEQDNATLSTCLSIQLTIHFLTGAIFWTEQKQKREQSCSTKWLTPTRAETFAKGLTLHTSHYHATATKSLPTSFSPDLLPPHLSLDSGAHWLAGGQNRSDLLSWERGELDKPLAAHGSNNGKWSNSPLRERLVYLLRNWYATYLIAPQARPQYEINTTLKLTLCKPLP